MLPDTERGRNNLLPLRPHMERCEVVRHCRWVDEVIPDAPWALDEDYFKRHKIDYVAVEEGSTGMSNAFRVYIRSTEISQYPVDPSWDKTRLKGYDTLKGAGHVPLALFSPRPLLT